MDYMPRTRPRTVRFAEDDTEHIESSMYPQSYTYSLEGPAHQPQVDMNRIHNARHLEATHRAPLLPIRSLPGTPELEQSSVEPELEPWNPESPSPDVSRTPSPDGSWESSSDFESQSTTPDVQPSTILSPFLSQALNGWDVRKPRSSDALSNTLSVALSNALSPFPSQWLDSHAFLDGRKSCLLHFVVSEANDWTTQLGQGYHGGALTVREVLRGIWDELYMPLEGIDARLLRERCPQNDRIREDRLWRVHGQEDSAAIPDVFRNIDYFPKSSLVLGLLVEDSPSDLHREDSFQVRVLMGTRL